MGFPNIAQIMSEQSSSMPSPSSFPDASRPLRLAQLVSRFPMVTETFVLYELEAMEKLGVTVELYSLLRENSKVVHREAGKWIRRAHYLPFLSPKILRAHWHFIRFAVLVRLLRSFPKQFDLLMKWRNKRSNSSTRTLRTTRQWPR